MQCPNCQMNIKDDSQFCIHCGTRFSNSMSTTVSQVQNTAPVQPSICPKCQQPIQAGSKFCTNCGSQLATNQVSAPSTPDQILQQNQQALANEQNERDKYLRAYFGSSYDKVMNSNFSIGTFLLGWWWLIAYKLYGLAGKMFLIFLGLSIASRIVLAIFVALFGVFGGLFAVIAIIVAYIWVDVIFAKNFFSDRTAKASLEIDSIIRSTDNETERLERCKKAGRPLYFVLILAFILPVLTLLGIVGIFLMAVGASSRTIDNSRKDYFLDTSKAYINSIKNAVAADELKCGEVYSKLDPGVYYYTFTTASGDSATNLLEQGGRSSWGNANVSGQIIILKLEKESYSRNQFAAVMVDEEGRGIGSFDEKGHPTEVISEIELRRASINTKDGNGRKNFYNMTKFGTTTSFEKTAPLLTTTWDGTSLEEMLEDNGIKNAKKPIACEIIG